MLNLYDHGVKSGSAGSVQTFEIKGKEVSHLIIKQKLTGGTTPVAKHTIKVDVVTEEFQGVLVDSLDYSIAKNFHDIDRGLVGGTTTEFQYAILIGTQRLKPTESIIVTLTDTSTGLPTTVAFTVGTIMESNRADVLFRYGKTTADINTLQDVNAVLMDLSSVGASDSIDLRINGKGTIVSKDIALMLNSMLASENVDLASVGCVFYEKDYRPAQVNYEMKTTAGFTIYYRQIIANSARVIRSLEQGANSEIKRTQIVASVSPEKANALGRAGLITPVQSLPPAYINQRILAID